MKKRGSAIFFSVMLILALSISLIPIYPNTNAYAETTTSPPNFLVPVTPLTEVPDGYIGIYTKKDLDQVRYNLNQNYILMDDITFTKEDFSEGGAFYNNGAGWIPIGQSSVYEEYSGTFDGNGHVVKNLFCNATGNSSGGLFYSISFEKTIKNLAVLDCDITAELSAYGIGCGYGNYENCTVSGNITSIESAGIATGARKLSNCLNLAKVTSIQDETNTMYAAGISIHPYDVSNCVNVGSVSAVDATESGQILYSKAGGICIDADLGVRQCRNYGTVYASSYTDKEYSIWAYAGGITVDQLADYECCNYGLVMSESSLQAIAGGITAKGGATKSYNAGLVYAYSINDSAFAGGIVGSIFGAVRDCFNTGEIEAEAETSTNTLDHTGAGGIVGYGASNIFTSYNTGSAVSTRTGGAGGIIGTSPDHDNCAFNCYSLGYPGEYSLATTITQAQMAVADTFAGFDFSTQWKMDPKLQRPVIMGNEPETYGIRYFLDGLEKTELTPSAYMVGVNNTLPVLISTGYTVAWFSNEDLTSAVGLEIPYGTYGDIICYAKWIPNIYTIKFNDNGVTTGSMANLAMTYDLAKNLTPIAFKKTGYSFLGWAKTSTGTVAYKDKASVKNLTATNKATVNLYAKWGAPIASVGSYSYNSIKVTWAAAGSATSYKIYRATSASGTYSLVKTAASTSRSWIDTGRVTGKNYYYKIYPVAGGTTYKFSTYKSAKAVPATPSMTLTKASTTSIKVAWTGVTGATKYLVYRAGKSSSSNTYGDYTLVHTASSADRSWINTGRTIGSTYKYKVRAYHLEGTTKVYGSFSAVEYLKI